MSLLDTSYDPPGPRRCRAAACQRILPRGQSGGLCDAHRKMLERIGAIALSRPAGSPGKAGYWLRVHQACLQVLENARRAGVAARLGPHGVSVVFDARQTLRARQTKSLVCPDHRVESRV